MTQPSALNLSTASLRGVFWATLIVGIPLLMALHLLVPPNWDLSVPLIYSTGDDIWQLTLTKFVKDTGWVLTTPYLGAPDTADWHYHAAAQTSALHSVLMLALSTFIEDPVRLQQVYYLLNFPLICLTSFVACRLLGISRLPAFCVGLVFAFTTFRINLMFYAFLANYFMVPLALVPVIWILSGRFSEFVNAPEISTIRWGGLVRLLRSRDFLLGLLFVVLMAASDGYYAFFTLLLLGFAAFARVLIGDWRQPLALVPAALYIISLMGVALAIALPLQLYQQSHKSEFFPNGTRDASLFKRPVEAEVYSSSLKLLIAPIPNHRIETLGTLGTKILETHNEARKFRTAATVPLGTVGALLFAAALTFLAIPALRKRIGGDMLAGHHPPRESTEPRRLGDTLLSLTFFIFLCSIFGGIGTLIALAYPTIRAYERFPLFLIFVLYLGLAWFVTLKLRAGHWRNQLMWSTLLAVVTVAALFDQIPRDGRKGSESTKAQFLAERSFIRHIEAVLPPKAMVYQYPYSQYLSNSKYYGWGSFAHIRLYLHSRQLRWSNGGAKNTPGDEWNSRVAQLPLSNLLAEIEGAGFMGFVIDRTVVNEPEYQSVRRLFAERGYEVLEDAPSKLTFVRLRDPGFRVAYDPNYKGVDSIVVTDPSRIQHGELPGLVNGEAFKRLVNDQPPKAKIVISKTTHPEVFIDGAQTTRGLGQTAITPIAEMRGKLRCDTKQVSGTNSSSDTLFLTLENQSRFDWKLGGGPLPIGIGIHIRQPDGKMLRWDDGFRVPADAYIKRGASSTISTSINNIQLAAELRGKGPLVAEFAVVQDGNAWFENLSCTVALQ